MSLILLFIVFLGFTGIFTVFGINLMRGAIGLINRKFWEPIPENQRWAYCRWMGIGTILLGLGFLAGAAGIFFSMGLSEINRVSWGFGCAFVGGAPGLLLILGTNRYYNGASIPVVTGIPSRKKRKKK